MNYRHDIDGLRAVAVSLIVLFHLGVSELSGGFVGVDVFFVISGFLITKLVLKEVETGTFRYRDFYLRRLRRLGGPACCRFCSSPWLRDTSFYQSSTLKNWHCRL